MRLLHSLEKCWVHHNASCLNQVIQLSLVRRQVVFGYQDILVDFTHPQTEQDAKKEPEKKKI